MYDEGQLSNHRYFWNITLGEKDLNTHSQTNKTITEMVFIESSIKDGLYLCNLQVAKIETDAVPSNPTIFPLIKI